jgi:ketosteroid isomerase-like protein
MTYNAVAPIAGKIRTANQQFMKAFEDRDAARVASLYGEQALLFPPAQTLPKESMPSLASGGA